jgi:hypothetical protein
MFADQFAGAVLCAQKSKRREKMFGDGRLLPLDGNQKARIMVLARALMRRDGEGKHYGVLTAKFVAVLGALLWGFHNSRDGRCYPSYERIAEKADCARATVYSAINALEAAGIITWVNRIARIRDWGPDLFGRAKNRWRVIRTSNAYTFVDPQKESCPEGRISSKSKLLTGTPNQELHLLPARPLNPENPLHQALLRLEEGIRAAPDGAARSLAE